MLLKQREGRAATLPQDEIPAALDGVKLGRPVKFGGLTVYPMLASSPREPGYVTLPDALANGTARITEKSESGSVPELLVVNQSDSPLFILDGEELVGAMQNRMVNQSVMLKANSVTTIPVSCVERGRWRYEQRGFRDSPNTIFASARVAKTERMSESLAMGGRDADQARVWMEVDAMAANLRVGSPTGAMHDIFDSRSSLLQGYEDAFRPAEGQTGALFEAGGEVLGFDLFDSPATLRRYLPKLVRGNALEELRRPNSAGTSSRGSFDSVTEFLGSMRESRVRRYSSVGLGQDLRVSSGRVTGAGLVVDGVMIHLAGFRRRN
jgi:hypothetical protein